MLLGVMFLVSLGAWQVRRLKDSGRERVRYAERLAEPAFDASAPPADPDLRRVEVTGLPRWDRHFLLGGKYMWEQQGYQVIVPVEVPGGAVLVNVGWVPIDEYEAIIERERSTPGPRSYEGLARVYAEDVGARGKYRREPDGYQRRWVRLSPVEMGAEAALSVAPFVVVEGEGIATDADIPDRVPPVGGWRTAPTLRPHGQYAFTWFSLAATLVLVWISASVQRRPEGG